MMMHGPANVKCWPMSIGSKPSQCVWEGRQDQGYGSYGESNRELN